METLIYLILYVLLGIVVTSFLHILCEYENLNLKEKTGASYITLTLIWPSIIVAFIGVGIALLVIKIFKL